MKRSIILRVLFQISLVLTMAPNCSAQEFNDTIISFRHDTLQCRITLVNDQNIFFELQDHKRILHEYLSLGLVKEYRLGPGSTAMILQGDSIEMDPNIDTSYVLSQLKEKAERENRILRNSIYLELLGSGIIYSLNYERVLHHKDFFTLSLRLGASYLPGLLSSSSVLVSAPLLANSIFRIYKQLYFECGTGMSYVFTRYYSYSSYAYFNEHYIGFSGMIGLRLQTYQGFLIRANFTPQIGTFGEFHLWGGASLGYSF